jgi:hypothetical protein
MGGDGIEVYQNPKAHTKQQTDELIRFAEECRIPVSGGSDCHNCKSENSMSTGMQIPLGILEEMKQRHRKLFPGKL